ncbi:MAG: hypothetical protein AAB933_01285 [Patescibacteria group bacterium]
MVDLEAMEWVDNPPPPSQKTKTAREFEDLVAELVDNPSTSQEIIDAFGGG